MEDIFMDTRKYFIKVNVLRLTKSFNKQLIFYLGFKYCSSIYNFEHPLFFKALTPLGDFTNSYVWFSCREFFSSCIDLIHLILVNSFHGYLITFSFPLLVHNTYSFSE